MADEIVKPGNETSEGWMAKVVLWASIGLAVVGGLMEMFGKIGEAMPGAEWVAKAMMILGVVSALLTQILWSFNRTALKKEALRLQADISSGKALAKLKER
jgi:hypothetical protein